MSALDKQEGGDHYKSQGSDQPIELCYRRYGYAGVKAALHCKIDKYITRKKDGELGQLKKARHCIDLMIEFCEKENSI